MVGFPGGTRRSEFLVSGSCPVVGGDAECAPVGPVAQGEVYNYPRERAEVSMDADKSKLTIGRSSHSELAGFLCQVWVGVGVLFVALV